MAVVGIPPDARWSYAQTRPVRFVMKDGKVFERDGKVVPCL